MRSSPDFSQWSQSRDPEGLAWEYREGKFYPLKLEDNSISPAEASQPEAELSQPPLKVRPYSIKEVRKRFKCGDRLLRQMRSSPDFSQWSQSRDPERLAWEYREGKFYPAI